MLFIVLMRVIVLFQYNVKSLNSLLSRFQFKYNPPKLFDMIVSKNFIIKIFNKSLFEYKYQNMKYYFKI